MQGLVASTINEHANIKTLVLAVISQAIRDLRGHDEIGSLNAALWFTGPDFGWWAEAAGIPFADGVKLLTTGAVVRGKVGRK